MEKIVRLTKLPPRIKAFTTKDSEGNYNIYINDMLSKLEQETEYLHELQHINDGDLDKPIDIEQKEITLSHLRCRKV